MAHYNTILHELLSLMPRHQFEREVRSLDGDRYVKKLSTWRQMTTLLERASLIDLFRLNEDRLAKLKRQDLQLCLQL